MLFTRFFYRFLLVDKQRISQHQYHPMHDISTHRHTRTDLHTNIRQKEQECMRAYMCVRNKCQSLILLLMMSMSLYIRTFTAEAKQIQNTTTDKRLVELIQRIFFCSSHFVYLFYTQIEERKINENIEIRIIPLTYAHRRRVLYSFRCRQFITGSEENICFIFPSTSFCSSACSVGFAV